MHRSSEPRPGAPKARLIRETVETTEERLGTIDTEPGFLPLPPQLSPRLEDALERLYDQRDQWVRPMDIGGRDGSDLSARLARLVALGLAESRQRRGDGATDYRRGSKLYRINDAGIGWYEAKHGPPLPGRSWMTMPSEEAEAVPCPRCDAPAGKPCASRRGRPHVLRQRAAYLTAAPSHRGLEPRIPEA